MTGIIHIVRGEVAFDTITWLIIICPLLFCVIGISLFVAMFFSKSIITIIKKGNLLSFMTLMTMAFGSFAIVPFIFALEEDANQKYAYVHSYLPLKERIREVRGKEWIDVREEYVSIAVVHTLGTANVLGVPVTHYAVTFDDGHEVIQSVWYEWDPMSGGFRRVSDPPSVGDRWHRLHGKSFNPKTYAVGDKEEIILFERIAE